MKKNVAIVTGGTSAEVVIALKSARVVEKNIDRDRYNAYLVIFEGLEWYVESNGNKYPVDKNDFTATMDDQRLKFDCVFVAMHGPPGENGKLQGYFDMLKIPYTTCGVLSSALTFNKKVCNDYLLQHGVKSAKSILIKKKVSIPVSELAKQLEFPCFVKPNESGSSFGISKVKQADELQNALNVAFEHSDEVLVDEYLQGTEVTCGAYRQNGEVKILATTEIVSKKEFFDYEAKYTPGMADEIVPARISPEDEAECHGLTKFIYEQLNLTGIARADFILKQGTFYLIEVNTIPGLSEESIVPKQARYIGMSLQELFSIQIEEALIK